jgi:hypothetical protein
MGNVVLDKIIKPAMAEQGFNNIKNLGKKKKGVMDSLKEGNMMMDKPRMMDILKSAPKGRTITISINSGDE